MNTEKVMKVLRQVEWRGDDFVRLCPSCRAYRSQGHTVSCKLAALLSEGEKAGAGKEER